MQFRFVAALAAIVVALTAFTLSVDDASSFAYLATAAAPAAADVVHRFDALHAEIKSHFEASGRNLKDIDARLLEIEQKMARRGGGGGGEHGPTSWGRQVVQSEAFKSFASAGQRGRVAIQVKQLTSASDSAGSLITPHRVSEPVLLPRQRPTIRVLLNQANTASNAIEFPKQTVRTLNAAPTTEGERKPESHLEFELETAPVRTIPHFIKASRQALDDAPQLMGIIDSELRYGLQLAEEEQILFGDGTGQNIEGIIPQATTYEVERNQAADSRFDTLAHAIAQAEAALLPATGIVMNNEDLKKLMTIKDGQGRYIGGGPFGPSFATIWQLPAVGTPQMQSGEFLVGAFFDGAQIFDRLLAEVVISTENEDDFVKNMITIRAEERLALTVRRPQAFIYGQFPSQSTGE